MILGDFSSGQELLREEVRVILAKDACPHFLPESSGSILLPWLLENIRKSKTKSFHRGETAENHREGLLIEDTSRNIIFP
jgi:hypothetical protein